MNGFHWQGPPGSFAKCLNDFKATHEPVSTSDMFEALDKVLEAMTPSIARVNNIIQGHLRDIAKLFKDGTHLTLIVRRDDPEQDMCVTDDDLDEVIEAVKRAKAREK